MIKVRIVRNIVSLLLGIMLVGGGVALAQCPVSVAVGGDGPRTKTEMNIGVMSGPTGMGMAKLMEDGYEIELVGEPTEVTAEVIKE